MSGEKRTTVTMYADEVDRLRMQALQAADIGHQNNILERMNRNLVNALRDSDDQIVGLQDVVNNMERHVMAMQTAHSREAQTLRDQLNQTVRESNARIQAQARETSRRMHEMQAAFSDRIQTVAAGITEMIEENNRDISRRIQRAEDTLRADIEASRDRIHAVEEEIRSIHSDNAALLDMAGEYQRTTAALNAETPRYLHGVEMLGGMKDVLRSSGKADGDIAFAKENPAVSGIAWENARAACEEALEFQQRAAAAEHNWRLHEQMARQTLEAAAAQLEASRVLTLEEDDVEVDVDYWSNGGLQALETRLDQLRRAAENSTAQTTVEDLDGLGQAARQIIRELGETVVFANLAIHESQNRADTAADFYESLYDIGVVLADSGYEGNDPRGPHRLHMTDRTNGDQLYIIQRPYTKEDGTIATRIEMDYCSDTPDQGLFISRQQEMLNTMGLGKDDCHDQEGVETVSGYETKPSDRVMPSKEAWANTPVDSSRIPAPQVQVQVQPRN